MASLDERMQRVESQLDRLVPSVQDRIDRLEQAAKTIQAAPQADHRGWGRVAQAAGRFGGWMGMELPKFLAAAVLLVVGWGIKDSVDLSIKQRQLDLSYAKEMQGLLQKMAESNADQAQLESSAAVLALYGEPALPLLLSELRYTGLRADAAYNGISSLALNNPEIVCDALPRVLSNHAQQYDWQAHLKIVRLLGDYDCYKAKESLKRYRATVAAAKDGRPEAFKELVRQEPVAPEEEYPLLITSIDKTLERLSK